MQKAREIERLAGAEIFALRPPDDIGRDHDRDHEPRDDAGGIEPRDGFFRRRPVNDHGMLGGMITSIAPTAVMSPAVKVSG